MRNFIASLRSFIYNKSRANPKTDPWGTPQFIAAKVITIYELILITITKIGFKLISWNSHIVSDSILPDNLVVYNIKSFLQIYKDSSIFIFIISQSSILKLQDKICLEIILFTSESLNNLSPYVFNTWFSFPQINITMKHQVLYRASPVEPWNKIQKTAKNALPDGYQTVKMLVYKNCLEWQIYYVSGDSLQLQWKPKFKYSL